MNKIQFLITIFLTLIFLNACSTIQDGLVGKKKSGSNAFLVKKKAPLVLPPSYGELPKPKKKTGEKIQLSKENTLGIEEIIFQNASTDTSQEKDDVNSSIEKSIIDKINKQ